MKKIFQKNILKSINLLNEYRKKKPFNKNKHNYFIYLYLLYIQNNYNIDFELKNYTKSKGFIDCLKSLYKSNTDSKTEIFYLKI